MFNVNLPTRIISGKGCLADNKDLLRFGKKAVIVCGRSGAKRSGALDDVCALLDSLKTEYTVFDKIAENPPLLTCFEGGKLAKDCDFVIGIGGGSAIDAAKAVAAFATNELSDPMDIFTADLKPSLPIVAIPTTAGTGTEANPYSVLSLPDGETKRTFNSSASWPKVAFLDPSYTLSLPYEYTISTALDAFPCYDHFDDILL
jgi:alcohol dehydrogenase